MPDCLFCKIVSKEIPAKIYDEDGQIMVFYDIKPKAPVHLLIIPKKHIASISQAEESDRDLLGAMLLKAKEIAQKLSLSDRGFRLVANSGREAGQAIDHLHIHFLGGKPMSGLG